MYLGRLWSILSFLGLLLVYSECASWALERHDLQADAELEIAVRPHQIYLFCFSELENWISKSIFDHNVSLSISSSESALYGLLPSVIVYPTVDADQLPKHSLSCASLDTIGKEADSSIFSFLFPSTPTNAKLLNSSASTLRLSLPTYPSSCFAACNPQSGMSDESLAPTLRIQVQPRVNELNLLFILLGLVLLLSANSLSDKISVYYASGVGFVVLSSLLVLLIVFIRMLPMKRGGAVLQSVLVLLGGTFSMIFMLLDYVRSSVWQILAANAEITLCYVFVVGCLAFLFFYWFHLPEALVVRYPRTKTIMKYFLRVAGALLITSSVYLPFQERELLAIILDCTSFVLPEHLATEYPLTRVMEYSSPKLARMILVLIVVTLVELFEYLYNRTRMSPKSEKQFIRTPRADYARTSSPGSPWASSSPFRSESSFLSKPYQTPQKAGLTPQNPRSSFRNGIKQAHTGSSFRPSYMKQQQQQYRTYHRTPRNEILTDDESD